MSMPSDSREEARLLRSVGMGVPSQGKEDSRLMKHVNISMASAVDHGHRGVPRTGAKKPEPEPFVEKEFVDGVLRELNRARTEPKQYAEQLKELKDGFSGKSFMHPKSRDQVRAVKTEEGAALIDDAVTWFVEEMEPVPALTLNAGLCQVANDLAMKPGEPMETRLDRHGQAKFGRAQEITTYGEKSPEETVAWWILGDGDAERKIRKALMAKVYQEIGIATAPHPKNERYSVATLAIEFAAKA